MADENELVVLWTCRDREAALKTAFMFAHNSLVRGWWEKVTLIKACPGPG